MTFNEDGLLSHYDARGAELSSTQLNFIAHKLPSHIEDIQRMIETTTTGRLTELPSEVTFEMFWNRYGEKERSSKKKSLARWNRMSRTDQQKAYSFINRYELNLKPGIDKKYAETYLNAELWNN